MPKRFDTPPEGWVYVGNAAANPDRTGDAPGILMEIENQWNGNDGSGWFAGSVLSRERFAAPRHWLKTNSKNS